MLAKVVKQLTDMTALAERRAEILAHVTELEAVREECKWLRDYQQDEGRFKVGTTMQQCFCNRSSLDMTRTNTQVLHVLCIPPCEMDPSAST